MFFQIGSSLKKAQARKILKLCKDAIVQLENTKPPGATQLQPTKKAPPKPGPQPEKRIAAASKSDNKQLNPSEALKDLLTTKSLGKVTATAADFAAAGICTLKQLAVLDHARLFSKVGAGLKKAQARKIIKLCQEQLASLPTAETAKSPTSAAKILVAAAEAEAEQAQAEAEAALVRPRR